MIDRRIIDITKLRPQEEIYIALEELDFSWFKSQIETVREMWQAGEHIADIGERFGRDLDEVAILLIDLARKGKIKERPGGVFGDLQKVKG